MLYYRHMTMIGKNSHFFVIVFLKLYTSEAGNPWDYSHVSAPAFASGCMCMHMDIKSSQSMYIQSARRGQISYSRGSESRTRKLIYTMGILYGRTRGEFQHGWQNRRSTRVDGTCQQRRCEGFWAKHWLKQLYYELHAVVSRVILR